MNKIAVSSEFAIVAVYVPIAYVLWTVIQGPNRVKSKRTSKQFTKEAIDFATWTFGMAFFLVTTHLILSSIIRMRFRYKNIIAVQIAMVGMLFWARHVGNDAASFLSDNPRYATLLTVTCTTIMAIIPYLENVIVTVLSKYNL